MDVDYNWDYLYTLFRGVVGFEESTVVIESAREIKFRSLSLLFYYSKYFRLKKGRLPDLKFQNVNIEKKSHAKVGLGTNLWGCYWDLRDVENHSSC